MSDDLVKRLRDPAFGTETSERLLMVAAAERIEALTANLDDLQDRLDAANKARAHVMRMAVKKQGKIEALSEQLEAARADAKEAEAYAEELAGDQVDLCRQLIAAEDRLAKAVEVLTRLLATAHADDHDGWQDALKDARALLAEIEGEKT
jgi:hypothetical protein